MSEEEFKIKVVDIVQPMLHSHVSAYDTLLRNYTKDIQKTQTEHYLQMTKLIESHQVMIINFMKDAQPAIDVVKDLMNMNEANKKIWKIVFGILKGFLIISSVFGALWVFIKFIISAAK